jgi:hypothetical protein
MVSAISFRVAGFCGGRQHREHKKRGRCGFQEQLASITLKIPGLRNDQRSLAYVTCDTKAQLLCRSACDPAKENPAAERAWDFPLQSQDCQSARPRHCIDNLAVADEVIE